MALKASLPLFSRGFTFLATRWTDRMKWT
jgi:hypothetical protein